MASQKDQGQKARAARRTLTVGVRLTAAEIKALDTLVAQDSRRFSRAGIVATFAVDAMIAAGLLPPDHMG